MAKKPRKTKLKTSKFEQWEIDFMRSGPPEYSEQLDSPHKFAYLDGYHIWQKLKNEPGFDPSEYYANTLPFKNQEKLDRHINGLRKAGLPD